MLNWLVEYIGIVWMKFKYKCSLKIRVDMNIFGVCVNSLGNVDMVNRYLYIVSLEFGFVYEWDYIYILI